MYETQPTSTKLKRSLALSRAMLHEQFQLYWQPRGSLAASSHGRVSSTSGNSYTQCTSEVLNYLASILRSDPTLSIAEALNGCRRIRKGTVWSPKSICGFTPSNITLTPPIRSLCGMEER